MTDAETGSVLAPRDDPTQALSTVFDMPEEHRQAVAKFLNIHAEDPALPAVLAICAAHDLNPFLGEVFLIEQKVKVRNAEGKKEEVWRLKPGATRDGFLSRAQKSGLLRGLQGDVVCANDAFEVDWNVAPEQAPRVLHRHAPMLPGGEDNDPRNYRGEIIGAWAKGYRTDALPMFYFAPLREHGRTWTDSQTGAKGWAGAWSYTSAMIFKAAQSYVLRILFSITGVVPVDELRADPSAGEGGEQLPPSVGEVEQAIPTDLPDELRARLLAAVEEANQHDANLWPPAKCQMVFTGRPAEDVASIVEDIERTNAETRTMKERAAAAAEEPTEEETGEEDAPPEAEVVERTPEEEAEIDALRHRVADLTTGLAEADPGSEQHAALAAELDQVEAELRRVSGDTPGQGALDLDP